MSVHLAQVAQANSLCTRESLFRLWQGKKEEHSKRTPVPGGAGQPAELRCTPSTLICSSVCRFCGAGIAWGVVEDVQTSEVMLNTDERERLERTKGRWIPLDSDGMPHRCS